MPQRGKQDLEGDGHLTKETKPQEASRGGNQDLEYKRVFNIIYTGQAPRGRKSATRGQAANTKQKEGERC